MRKSIAIPLALFIAVAGTLFIKIHPAGEYLQASIVENKIKEEVMESLGLSLPIHEIKLALIEHTEIPEAAARHILAAIGRIEKETFVSIEMIMQNLDSNLPKESKNEIEKFLEAIF